MTYGVYRNLKLKLINFDAKTDSNENTERISYDAFCFCICASIIA